MDDIQVGILGEATKDKQMGMLGDAPQDKQIGMLGEQTPVGGTIGQTVGYEGKKYPTQSELMMRNIGLTPTSQTNAAQLVGAAKELINRAKEQPTQNANPWDSLQKAETIGVPPAGQEATPPMGSPAYIVGSIKHGAKNLAKLPQSIMDLSQAAPQMLGELQQGNLRPLGQAAAGFGKSLLDTINPAKWKEMIYNRPDEFVGNVLLLYGGLTGLKNLTGKLTTTTQTGAEVKNFISGVESINPDVKTALINSIPDDTVFNFRNKSLKLGKDEQFIADLSKGLNEQGIARPVAIPKPPDMGKITKAAVYMKRQFLQSPDSVFAKTEPGRRIYDGANTAELKSNAWLSGIQDEANNIYNSLSLGSNPELRTATTKLRDLHVTPDTIGDIPDNKLLASGLTQEEIGAIRSNPSDYSKYNNFLDTNLGGKLREYGVSLLGPDKEKMLWDKAQEARFDPKAKEAYDRVAASLAESDPDKAELADLYMNKIEDYIPHLFNKDELNGILQQELINITDKLNGMPQGNPSYQTLLQEKDRINASLFRLKGESPTSANLYEFLPNSVMDKFFLPRRGMPGYDLDSFKAYGAYMSALARKMFINPYIKEATGLMGQLPQDLQSYAKAYLQRFMGLGRNELTNAADSLKQLEWIRTIGLNPHTAIKHLSQYLNILSDVGPKKTWEAIQYAMSPEGREAYDLSGMKQTLDQTMWEGNQLSGGMENIRKIAGVPIKKVIEGVQRVGHAVGSLNGESPIEAAQTAFKYAFRFGKVGSPLGMTGPLGPAVQFWSYPIKQLEFLGRMAKSPDGIKKLLTWWAVSEGINGTAQDVLDTDLSDMLGVKLNYGQILKAVHDIPSGDWQSLAYHIQRGVQPGGMIPHGVGPIFGNVADIQKGIGSMLAGRGNEEFARAVEPAMATKLEQGAGALNAGPLVSPTGALPGQQIANKPGEEGKYVLRNVQGKPQFKESAIDVVKRFFAKPMAETLQTDKNQDLQGRNNYIKSITGLIRDKLDAGQTDEGISLLKKYQNILGVRIPITKKSITRAEAYNLLIPMTPAEQAERKKTRLQKSVEDYLNK